MLVSLNGLVLDKIEKENKKDNSKKYVFRLYQPGEKTNLDVTQGIGQGRKGTYCTYGIIY